MLVERIAKKTVATVHGNGCCVQYFSSRQAHLLARVTRSQRSKQKMISCKTALLSVSVFSLLGILLGCVNIYKSCIYRLQLCCVLSVSGEVSLVTVSVVKLWSIVALVFIG